MDDLYFENELKDVVKESIIKDLRYATNTWKEIFSKDFVSSTTEHVYQEFEEILYEYFAKKYEENRILDMLKEFKDKLTDKKLLERYKDYTFSQEELAYISLVELTKTWRGIHEFEVGRKYAIVDILLRKTIIEEFGEDSLEAFIDIMNNRMPHTSRYMPTINHYMQLFSEHPYGEEIQKSLEDAIEKSALYLFKDRINCGGYALKIDQCVFPTYQSNINQSISTLLERFPFVRLLGDTKLQEDEYLVIYRAPEGKNTGHHFIRVDSDGTVREKDGNGEPRIFNGWSESLQDAKEALFAVKKEHKMFGYDYRINHDNIAGLDFEGCFGQAIRNRQNTFSYHNQKYFLKKTSEGDIVVVNKEGDIVADGFEANNESIVEVRADKREYVDNISRGAKPVIINGKLINISQYRDEGMKTSEDITK